MTEVLSLVKRKDGCAMTEEDELALLPYGSLIELGQEVLSGSDALTPTIELVQRKDEALMTEEDEAALMPYSGLLLLLDLMFPDSEEEGRAGFVVNEKDLFAGFDRVERRDGKPMTEDDEEALLPYSGLISVLEILSRATGELEACPTGQFEGEEDQEEEPFRLLARRDGTPFTREDNDMLMQYGGAAALLVVLTNLVHETCDPFEQVARLDGKALDEDDEALLMEFYPAFKVFVNIYESMCTPLATVFYPDGDEDLAEYGQKLGETPSSSSEAQTSQSEGFVSVPNYVDDAELEYSAWSLVGNLLVAVYNKTFGSLESPWEQQQSSNSSGGLKRKPSGAELSAWIGLATQKSLRLDDPSRKVRTRAVL